MEYMRVGGEQRNLTHKNGQEIKSIVFKSGNHKWHSFKRKKTAGKEGHRYTKQNTLG